ncbi:MAG: hypothetical protein ACR2PL_15815 [Dehalococcoidia bacterium]
MPCHLSIAAELGTMGMKAQVALWAQAVVQPSTYQSIWSPAVTEGIVQAVVLPSQPDQTVPPPALTSQYST